MQNRKKHTEKTFTVSPYALIWKDDLYAVAVLHKPRDEAVRHGSGNSSFKMIAVNSGKRNIFAEAVKHFLLQLNITFKRYLTFVARKHIKTF